MDKRDRRAYYQENKEEVKARSARRYQEYKEEVKARSARRYQEHKEEINVRIAKWQAASPEKV